MAIKWKNIYRKACAGEERGWNFLAINLCMPYPESKTAIIKTPVNKLIKILFLKYYPASISRAFCKAASVGFSPAIICAIASVLSASFNNLIAVVIFAPSFCLYT